MLLSSMFAWPLCDDLCDSLSQNRMMSSWLFARLWYLTSGSVGVKSEKEYWSDGAVLDLDFLLLDTRGRPAAHVLFELNESWFGTTLTWSTQETKGGIDFDDPAPPAELGRLCNLATSVLTDDVHALGHCRVIVCDYERAALPWVCGWDGTTFGSAERFEYGGPDASVIRPLPRR